MPHEMIQTARASEGHDAVQRGDLILMAARQAFVEKGFDGASMQDLARAAGMSAGNFYRYFPSKAALVEAMVGRDMAEIDEVFQRIVASPDPVVALKVGLRQQMIEHCEGKDDLLWAEIAAAAARKPEVAAILGKMEERITCRIAQVIGIAAGLHDEDEALRRFGTRARLIFLIMHGAMTSNLSRDATPDVELTELVLLTLERVVDDALAESKAS